MNIRLLTDKEADDLWAVGAPLYHRFVGECTSWVPHRSTSPAYDRENYAGANRWEFGAEVE